LNKVINKEKQSFFEKANRHGYIRQIKIDYRSFVKDSLLEIVVSIQIALNNRADIDIDPDMYKLLQRTQPLCTHCKSKVEFLAVERSFNSKNWRFNTYTIIDGSEVLMTKDHIEPIAQGGKNHISNLQLMCKVCNNEKGNMNAAQWSFYVSYKAEMEHYRKDFIDHALSNVVDLIKGNEVTLVDHKRLCIQAKALRQLLKEKGGL
jgi:5-methylcytosine-specific restriction endonuclease McrA